MTPLTGGGVPIDLGDDGDATVRTSILAPPLPKASIRTQESFPVRAARAKVFARGNVLVAYSWNVKRTHDSVSSAMAFARDHVKQIAAAAALGQFVLLREAFGVTMRSVGALTDFNCDRTLGVGTWFTYAWKGTPFE